MILLPCLLALRRIPGDETSDRTVIVKKFFFSLALCGKVFSSGIFDQPFLYSRTYCNMNAHNMKRSPSRHSEPGHSRLANGAWTPRINGLRVAKNGRARVKMRQSGHDREAKWILARNECHPESGVGATVHTVLSDGKMTR
jgi:hypothetical protein